MPIFYFLKLELCLPSGLAFECKSQKIVSLTTVPSKRISTKCSVSMRWLQLSFTKDLIFDHLPSVLLITSKSLCSRGMAVGPFWGSIISCIEVLCLEQLPTGTNTSWRICQFWQHPATERPLYIVRFHSFIFLPRMTSIFYKVKQILQIFMYSQFVVCICSSES